MAPARSACPREIAAAVILAAGLAALRVVRARWPQVGADALWLSAGMTGVIVLVLLPAQGTEVPAELREARIRQGLLAGSVGGALAAYHPRKPRPARSWAAGLFVRSGS
jgi:hypothetical protein